MYLFIKRLLDCLFAVFLLIFLFPIFIVAPILIKINSKGPAFLLQKRIGLNNDEFFVIKFRTMIVEREKNGIKLTDPERIFTIGKFLRQFSIDELPQLLNVVKGDMSFIGPRPLPSIYLPFYTEEEKKRHNVRPGLSGWAQVNGRNYLTWEKKFKYDLFYVNKISLYLDLKIFFLTIKKVLMSKDIGILGADKIQMSLHEIRGKK